MYYIIGSLLFILFVSEVTILQIPFSVIILLLFFVTTKSQRVFFYSFILGIILDVLLMRNVGVSSLFLVSFLFFISLYDKKYEINTGFFVLVAGFIGSLLFSYTFGYSSPILQATLGTIAAVFGFIGVQMVQSSRIK